jgi:DNA (cytosine-5)-methyltransferase 1
MPVRRRPSAPPPPAPAPHEPAFRFIDLFCGIGGFRLAFENEGCECVFSSDWDAHARQTYAANFGEEPAGDIRLTPAGTIRAHDILCAGFPCQPFSLAGVSKKNSLGRAHGFDDEKQGNLFYEIVRLLDHHRPAAFLLENVKNLKSHDKGNTFRVIHRALTEDLGYHVHVQIIDARHWLPQHRERIFLAGFREPRPFSFPTAPPQGPRLGSILQPAPDPRYTLSDKLWQYLQDYAAKHAAKGNGFGCSVFDETGVARTLSARYHKDGSEILIRQPGQNPRRLTPRECARLMGYPDTFRIPVSDTQAYRQFGNSVAVPVIRALARQVLSALRQPPGMPAPLTLE